ncbi:MAG: hypothetical protein WCJ35_24190 [Planctomycetota bacterium]
MKGYAWDACIHRRSRRLPYALHQLLHADPLIEARFRGTPQGNGLPGLVPCGPQGFALDPLLWLLFQQGPRHAEEGGSHSPLSRTRERGRGEGMNDHSPAPRRASPTWAMLIKRV